MSLYVQDNFSQDDQNTLDRPDFRPRLHHSFVAEPDPNVEVRRSCVLITKPSCGPTHDPGERETPRIRRQDLEDFRRTWLWGNYRDSVKLPVLRGQWTVDNSQNNGAVMIVQYRTFKICLIGEARTVVLSSADVGMIMDLCLASIPGEEMPRWLVELEHGDQYPQWLLAPVDQYGLKYSIDAFRRETEGSVVARGRPGNQNAVIAELRRRQENAMHGLGDSRSYEEIVNRNGIDQGWIDGAEAEDDLPSDTFEVFSDEDLEHLLLIVGGNKYESGPLPLRADDREDWKFPLDNETTDLIAFHLEEMKDAACTEGVYPSQCSDCEPSNTSAVQPYTTMGPLPAGWTREIVFPGDEWHIPIEVGRARWEREQRDGRRRQ
ncbi:hypothetical protein Daus18300_011915 [Diaporthe australafricana]|uniref:Uncharacterized protein n=1 Tax=Diaporthe australafricana TaxID=127596 RepID=A0ABR3W519_9PEZI